MTDDVWADEAARRSVVSIGVGFDGPVEGQRMRPRMGVGRRP